MTDYRQTCFFSAERKKQTGTIVASGEEARARVLGHVQTTISKCRIVRDALVHMFLRNLRDFLPPAGTRTPKDRILPLPPPLTWVRICA